MIIKKVLHITKSTKVFIYKESIAYPLIEFESSYNKKDLFFLSENRYIKVLSCIQFSAMGSLF